MKMYCLIFSLALIGALGCGSTAEKANSEQRKEMPVSLNASSKVDSKVKAPEKMEKVTAVEASEISIKSCKRDLKGLNLSQLVDSANACALSKNWSDLEKVALVISEKYSKSPWGFYYLSIFYENKQDVEKARWYLTGGLKKNPKSAHLLFAKARLEWLVGENSVAASLLREALTINPELIEAREFLADIHFRDQEFEQAAEHYAVVLRFKPREKRILGSLAECYIQIGNSSKAIEVINSAVAAHPQHMQFQLKQGFVYDELMQNPTQAHEVYKKMIELSSRGKLDEKVPPQVQKRLSEIEKTLPGLRVVAGSEPEKGAKKK